MSTRMTFCGCLLGVIPFAITTVAGEPLKLPPAVEEYRKLEEKQLKLYAKDLAAKGRLADLESICNSDAPYHWYAAAALVRAVDSDKVVGVCSKFDLDSMNWKAAMLALDAHPKKRVIGYVKQLATSSDPNVRYFCYTLCRQANWPDLIEIAKRDLESPDRVAGVGGSPLLSIRDVAAEYLKRVE